MSNTDYMSELFRTEEVATLSAYAKKPDYISRSALGIGKCNPDVFEDKGYAKGWNSAVDIVMNAPAADVRPVVTCSDCKYNNACLTQAFVEEESRVPFDRNTFFCADGVKREES